MPESTRSPVEAAHTGSGDDTWGGYRAGFEGTFKINAADFKMGYASALAWILFIIILVLTLIQMKLAPRWVHYEVE